MPRSPARAGRDPGKNVLDPLHERDILPRRARYFAAIALTWRRRPRLTRNPARAYGVRVLH